MTVTMLGCNGVMPTEKKPLTAMYIQMNGRAVLIDCGEGVQLNLINARVSKSNIEVICLTHYHPDHVLGLPGLISTINANIMSGNGETKDILLIGPPDPENVIEKLLGACKHENVSLLHYVVGNRDGQEFDFGTFVIRCRFVEHTVPCLGYEIIEKSNAEMNVPKANSSEIPQEYWGVLQKGFKVQKGSDVYGLDAISTGCVRYRKVAYVTDTVAFDGIKEFIRGADLAVLEGMYEDESSRRYKAAHMTMQEAAQIAKDAWVRELWLTHFSPSLCNAQRGIERAREIFHNTKGAHLGQTKEIV